MDEARLRLNHVHVLQARIRHIARIDLFLKVMCQNFQHVAINIAFAVDRDACVIPYTMTEPSAATSVACSEVFFSRNSALVTPKIIYFYYLKEYFLDQSI